MKYDIYKIQEEIKNGKQTEFLFFWENRPASGKEAFEEVLSQWWQSGFEKDGILYSSAEKWMMAEKARLFKDSSVLSEILKSDNPEKIKKLGREITGFHHEIWDKNKYSIVMEGNVLKFSQDEKLKNILLNTGDKILVEASPYDRIWGIGMSKSDPDCFFPEKWKGENLLGFALMEVRDILNTNSV